MNKSYRDRQYARSVYVTTSDGPKTYGEYINLPAGKHALQGCEIPYCLSDSLVRNSDNAAAFLLGIQIAACGVVGEIRKEEPAVDNHWQSDEEIDNVKPLPSFQPSCAIHVLEALINTMFTIIKRIQDTTYLV